MHPEYMRRNMTKFSEHKDFPSKKTELVRTMGGGMTLSLEARTWNQALDLVGNLEWKDVEEVKKYMTHDMFLKYCADFGIDYSFAVPSNHKKQF